MPTFHLHPVTITVSSYSFYLQDIASIAACTGGAFAATATTWLTTRKWWPPLIALPLGYVLGAQVGLLFRATIYHNRNPIDTTSPFAMAVPPALMGGFAAATAIALLTLVLFNTLRSRRRVSWFNLCLAVIASGALATIIATGIFIQS